MSFSKAVKLIFSDMVFKSIVTIMIVVLTVQSTVRDYDYTGDIKRIDSSMVSLVRLVDKVDVIAGNMGLLDARVDSVYTLYNQNVYSIKSTQGKLATKSDASNILAKFDAVSAGIMELSTLIKERQFNEADTIMGFRHRPSIQVTPSK